MLEVLEPGPLTSVQDVVGRREWRRFGVPFGGAADPWSARLANRLGGNHEEAPLLEMAHGGARVRFDAPAVIAVTGGLEASIDGLTLRPNAARVVRGGAILRLEPGRGARGYLAVGGGVVVEPVLGSAATDLRTGFGGHEGRALRAGDRLTIGAPGGRPGRWVGRWDDGPIRISSGPHADAVPEPSLVETAWRVSAEADRTGIRLDGPALRPDPAEVPSMGLALGAVQLPPDGRPIVMLADRPVTGGYPVPAVVIGADAGRVAQLRPGDELRFRWVTTAEARDALRHVLEQLAAVEPLDSVADDELGWTGSHR